MTTATIGLFYGSSTCYTEIAAEKIQQYIGRDNVDLYNLADDTLDNMATYDYLVFGIPTWDYGELQEDWEAIWEQLDTINFSGKKIALYGLGDQVGYPDWFQDAMGYLWSRVIALGAQTVGYWPIQGYEFNNSQATTKDGKFFVGLSLDEENQFELTDARIKAWCQQIWQEFGLY